MKLVYQIPRNSLAWLLISFLAVIAPHVEHLPGWIVLTAIVSLVWRVHVYRGLWKFPPAWIKYLLTMMSVAGLFLGYGRLTGLEPMVALLIIGFSFKLIEMHQRRDALAFIYLAYLVSATQLLFTQTITGTLYVFVTYLLITTALMGLNQSQGVRYPLRSLGLAGKLVLQSIPLMLLLFIVMPRLGALWTVPLQEHAAKTGVSDTMAPGDFSSLGRSGDVAFRVSFDGDIPPPADLYWRGLVLSRFDGRRWSQAEPTDYFRDGAIVRWYQTPHKSWESLIEKQGDAIRYDVILEPTQQRWLYALATPEPQDRKVGLSRDFRLISQFPVQRKQQYRVTSYLDHKIEAALFPDWRFKNETQLPEGFNPETLALAREWRSKAGSDEAYINQVLHWFNQEFIYTIEPPLLGKHTADEFLLTTKRGFCEHFANSFALLMRAANIPARVVAGYQGGEVNPYEEYLLVHQFDAHAWTEVWLPGKGWVRVDPTAAVAPERIEKGLQDVIGEASFLSGTPFALVRYQRIPWLHTLRLQLDRIDYAWHRWVLGFDLDKQTDLLTSILGDITPLRLGVAFMLTSGVILGVIGFRLVVQTRPPQKTPVNKAYRKFCDKLTKLGFVRKNSEAPGTFAQRVIRLRPDLNPMVIDITRLYEALCYESCYTTGMGAEKQLIKLVSRFRPTKKVKTSQIK